MAQYKLLFFAEDGDNVTDGVYDDLVDVLNRVENIGSTWFFYPWPMVFKQDRHGNWGLVLWPDEFQDSFKRGMTLAQVKQKIS